MKKFFAALPFILFVLWLFLGTMILSSFELAIVTSVPLLCIICIELVVIFIRQVSRHNFRKLMRDKKLMRELKETLSELDYYR